ncbi:uncharacterized protein DUF4301 [Bacteroides zoogleoformans]|uniref:DUF4301 domain-containing protein n=1 Tax=Bacteroides zoogleoformans TaxID=28119 RepID=A0ABN5IGS6_9BACE|nr:DUF4301 family protein [Bacteroides zoogleoformans]AVM51897.1 DUF4301 domain-containing protein [Bacteroides zoogleoformans]TWJ16998.1 uncharacterized protein DUF4301 [Bacteroides zoogleoformans]
MMTPQDKELLKSKGISEKQIAEQLTCFEKGFPYLNLFAAASIDRGVLALDTDRQKEYLDAWEAYTQADKEVVKFVPASGAASRMFKNLFEFLGADYTTPQTDFEKLFFEKIENFAFYGDLNEACRKTVGKDIASLVATGDYKAVVAALLEAVGLNYGALPKGLLKFHKYEEGSRTPLEEHLVEGALYAVNKNAKVNVHFTVSPEHRALFGALVNEKAVAYAKKYGVEYNVTFSEQKASTDTIAVDMENKPFRDAGKLLFRPGGHGALIENLNDLDADVIFIKNIDNVVPDRLKGDTVLHKKLIAGVLVTLQQRAFAYLQLLNSGKYTHEQLLEILQFLQKQLYCKNPETKNLEDAELAIYLKKKLNRPMRVCGMVKNVGEPGGGPFLAYNSDGTVSLQILESSQIDMSDPEKKEMFEKGTHFNPVDLVCAVRDYKGDKFDLTKYVDKATGFISYKSKNGKDLKALELPGLWNGAMSDWNTVFVEVPLSTFNPVKTVNDLLREQHQ